MRFLNKQVPPRHPHPRSQQGITLIELMIALVIGLLATGAMLKVYVDSSRLYRFNESLARIQENGRFGLEFIRRDARMAGFWGCNSAVDPFIQLTPGTTLPDFLLSGLKTTLAEYYSVHGSFPDDGVSDSNTTIGAEPANHIFGDYVESAATSDDGLGTITATFNSGHHDGKFLQLKASVPDGAISYRCEGDIQASQRPSSCSTVDPSTSAV